MPINVAYGPSNFYYKKGSQVPAEGLISVPLTLDVSGSLGDPITDYVLAGNLVQGLVFDQDFSQITGIQRLSQIKSVSLTLDLQSSIPTAPIMYLFVPDSGQLYTFASSRDSEGCIINAAVQIVSNGTRLVFVFVGIVPDGAAQATFATLTAQINNFERMPFVDRQSRSTDGGEVAIIDQPIEVTVAPGQTIGISGQPIEVTTTP